MTKSNSSFSSWSKLLQGLLAQGSVFSSILFHVYLNDLFSCLNCNIWQFPDDATLYIYNSSLNVVLENVEQQYDIAMT